MLSDREILRLLIHRPEKGLEKLMDQYMGLVYTIVDGKLSSGCSKQDIEECVSDIFYEIYRTAHSIDLEKGSVKSYLAVLAKRKAINIYRKHKNSTDQVSMDEFDHDWMASDANVEEAVTGNETSDRLIDEIQALGDPDSQIMIRKYYFGQSTKIIAKALGLKENTVDKKVSRALAKLRQALGGVL